MKFVIYGATGQCKVMRPILERHGQVVATVDPFIDVWHKPFLDVPHYQQHHLNAVFKHPLVYFIVAIGNPHGQKRTIIATEVMDMGYIPASPIHSSAIFDIKSNKAIHIQVHAGVIVNPGAVVQSHTILNTGCIVEHDSVIGLGAEVGPGAVVCGETKIGNYTWVGAGAVVKDHLTIGENVIIGCGAVVVKDIPDNVVVVGNPAKVIRENKND